MSLPDPLHSPAFPNDEIQRRLHAVIRTSRQEALAALASKVAHDLNNVLQVVGGRLDLIDQYPILPSEDRGDVQNAMVGIDLAHRLLGQLRSYVLRDDFGLPQLHVATLMQEVAALMQAELPPQIHLLSETIDPSLQFPGHRDQICAALIELEDERRALAERAEGDGLPLAAMIKDDERCIRCGLCAVRCPTDAMTMERFSITERWAEPAEEKP